MKPSTFHGPVHERLDSADTTHPATATLRPAGCSVVWLCAETNNARVTFDGSDPSGANAASIVIPTGGLFPFPFSIDTPIRHVSTAAAHSILQILYGE